MDLELTDEQQSIVEVFGALADRWAPPAGLREHEALGFDPKVWEQLVATGTPGMALPEADGGGGATLLDLALAVEALGRRLTPAPLVEHAVAARLLARIGALTPRIAEGATIAAVALRPAVDGRSRLVPAGAVADAVVALDGDRLVCTTGAAPGGAVPNLADLPLADRDLDGATVLATGDDARELHALALHEWRALTAAALVGLAAGALELARTYVLEREQFDVRIGSFQSIQHTLADAKVGIDGAQLLAYKANWAFTAQPARAAELATMALLFAAEQARVTSERGLHFHGGYGVMVEYDIQLFYRRAKGWALVLADPRTELHHLADLRYGTVGGVALMDFTTSPEALAFRDEVRALLERTFTPEVREQMHHTGTLHNWGIHHALGEAGWLQQALPESLGGGGRDPEELAGLFREFELAGAPYDGISNVVMISSVLAHMGNDMQKRDVLPKLLSGEAVAALGYSEPDSGSDVAAARTTATRDGDGWRINGAKMFTSVAEEATWALMLTRTDPDVPKHKGLTFFLVPLDRDGVEIQPVFTLSGKRTNATFYDDVFVEDEWRVGEVDGGWQVMLVALSYERGVAGGVRDAERLLVNAEAYARDTLDGEGRPLIEQPTWHEGLAKLAVDVEVADLLAGRAAWVSGSGRLPGTEGAHVKLFATEAVTRAANTFADLAGPEGLRRGDPAEDRSRLFEYFYRFAPVTTIYGGTSEIQRNLVAQRGLGLPRGR